MNRDKVLKWVTALESGKYRQGNGQLVKRNEDGELEWIAKWIRKNILKEKGIRLR